jgi:hypothetical protein
LAVELIGGLKIAEPEPRLGHALQNQGLSFGIALGTSGGQKILQDAEGSTGLAR